MDKLATQMQHRLRIEALLDCYGALLPDKQRDLLDVYHNQDLSLAELAEEQSVSRQAVHEAIKRGESALLSFEVKLGFLAKQEGWQDLITELQSWPLESDAALDAKRTVWLRRAEALLQADEER